MSPPARRSATCSGRSACRPSPPRPLATRPRLTYLWRHEQAAGKTHRVARGRGLPREGQGDAGERGKERGAGQPAPEGVGHESAEQFQDSPGPAGEDAAGPDKIGILGLLPEGSHDEKEVGHEADRVDAERQGGDVVAPRANGQAVGLPGVKEVAEKDGDSGGRQNPGNDDFHGNAANRGDERKNEEKLEEIVDEQADKSVQVSSNEPAGFHEVRLR